MPIKIFSDRLTPEEKRKSNAGINFYVMTIKHLQMQIVVTDITISEVLIKTFPLMDVILTYMS